MPSSSRAPLRDLPSAPTAAQVAAMVKTTCSPPAASSPKSPSPHSEQIAIRSACSVTSGDLVPLRATTQYGRLLPLPSPRSPSAVQLALSARRGISSGMAECGGCFAAFVPLRRPRKAQEMRQRPTPPPRPGPPGDRFATPPAEGARSGCRRRPPGSSSITSVQFHPRSTYKAETRRHQHRACSLARHRAYPRSPINANTPCQFPVSGRRLLPESIAGPGRREP